MLPLAIRSATKLVPFLTSGDKLYVGTIRLGEDTDTLDAEGEVTRRYAGPLPDEGQWGVGGLGVAFSAISAGFLVDELNAVSALEDNCGESSQSDGRFHCATAPEDDVARKDRSLGLAIGFGVAGVAALGVGAYGIATGLLSGHEDGTQTARVVPLVGPTGLGLSVRGHFE